MIGLIQLMIVFAYITTQKPPQLNYGGFISIFIHSPKP